MPYFSRNYCLDISTSIIGNIIKIKSLIKPGLHPRNKHNLRYDFPKLIESSPGLSKFVSRNKYNDDSIDFADPEAVKALNQALLKFFYKINFWDIPKNYLCPPIPGRADYIHQIADLLGASNKGSIPTGKQIRILDIGVGANCVYPLIATSEYGWSCTGSDIDPIALKSANEIILQNNLDHLIELRSQDKTHHIFKGVISENDFFDVTISNPPFHSSLEEAQSGNLKKNKNLGKNKISKHPLPLNFGGVSNELWCEGGEISFASKMIRESKDFKSNCFWFTTLISKATSLPSLYQELKMAEVRSFKTIDMGQGQKKSRILAWTFRNI